MAIRHYPFAAMVLLLTACSSMPLSTMMRGASFNENTVAFVDARVLRVKVSLPKGFVIDVTNTKLTALIDSTTGSRKTELALQSLETTQGKRPGGMVSDDVAVTSFEMDLPEESVKALRELQRFVSEGKVKKVSLDVKVALTEAPEGAASVKVWIEIMMSPMEGYVTLIDGGTIPLNRTVTYGGK